MIIQLRTKYSGIANDFLSIGQYAQLNRVNSMKDLIGNCNPKGNGVGQYYDLGIRRYMIK